MDGINLIGVTVLAALLTFFLFQFWLRSRMKRMVGKQAPVVESMGDNADQGRHLYYFFSPACGPCRSMTPVIEQLAERHPNVNKVDVSITPEVAMKFGVMGTPSVVLVDEGVVTEVLVGAQSPKVLESLLD